MWPRTRRSTSPAPERVKALAEPQERPESSMAEWASEKIPTKETQRDSKIDNYPNTSNYPNASNDKLLISNDDTRIRAPHSAGTTQLATAQLASACPLSPLGSKRTCCDVRLGSKREELSVSIMSPLLLHLPTYRHSDSRGPHKSCHQCWQNSRSAKSSTCRAQRWPHPSRTARSQ